ncbi:hypothetical protein L873DRAFT_1790952 [Choiromyces venosus 120613-1]|uniref:Uncharacterized protein n=1 Tax=Choiromyces venosus 120613-1 TaxID=1336337 RepID=A0A3N4JL30_9PEZI|nr:hypothetical protein L873DRAFT_1790952 [Choiromyces venosus 120613-1]
MFTEADIKGLLRTYPVAPPYIELLSGTGIVTEATLRNEIFQRILNSPDSPGRTSVFELGKDFSVEARVIERLLPAQQGDWARVGASTIITAPEIQRLRDEIQKDLDSGLIHVSSFFVTPMSKEGILDGKVKNGYFIPNKYVRAQQEDLVQELKKEGILDIQSLKKAGVQDPPDFISERDPSSQLLTTHFVTEGFLEDVRNRISEKISTQMWSDLEFLDTRLSSADTSALITLLTAPDGSPLEEIGPFAVSAALLPSLTTTLASYAKSLAEKAHAKGTPNPTLKQQELSKHLSSKAPRQVISHYISTLHPPALSLFNSHFESFKFTEISDAQQTFADKYYTPLVVHKRAIDGLSDKSLRFKLEADLLIHCREVIIPSLGEYASTTPGVEELCSKLTEARELGGIFSHLSAFIGNKLPDTDAMQAVKDSMIQDLGAQLQASNDSAEMVLLALLILLARKGHGALRFSEKNVPVFVPKKQRKQKGAEEPVAEKLLKEVKRKKLPEGVPELLDAVMGAIMKKQKVEEGDVEKLKGVGNDGVSG